MIAKQLVHVNGVGLCTESYDDPADPAILLVMGLGGSMLWWPDGFCRLLAESGRFVIRYDQRDTGRSTTYEPGHPGYSGGDLLADAVALLADAVALLADAVALLDAYRLPAAHLVGVSSGGALVQLLALDLPSRVLSLVLISTSPAVPGDRNLPLPSAAFAEFARSATVDRSDTGSVLDYLVAYARVLAGEERRFDQAEARDLVRRDLERARNVAALQNHNLLDDDRPRKPLSWIEAPTVVIHGTADPMFPLSHGQALAAEIPSARLLALEGAGHGVQRADWDTITEAITSHTARRVRKLRRRPRIHGRVRRGDRGGVGERSLRAGLGRDRLAGKDPGRDAVCVRCSAGGRRAARGRDAVDRGSGFDRGSRCEPCEPSARRGHSRSAPGRACGSL